MNHFIDFNLQIHSSFSRFVILKLVPRDHVDHLPVPNRIKDYLKTPNYYSENINIEEHELEEDIEASKESDQVIEDSLAAPAM